MKLYHTLLYASFWIILGLFAVYSYVLIDPNLSIGSLSIERIREQFLQFGYYQRETSSLIYVGFVCLAFAFHFYFVRHTKRYSILRLIIPLSLLGLFSYPFLSHDVFNYMFDAKIFTYYGQNPYLHKALDFPGDPWLRFMRWTHRSYTYGPTFLPLTLLPSWLGAGKFFLTLFLFKAMFLIFYLSSTYSLEKMNKKWAVLFATHPLVIFEGLVNAHNDLIAVSLAIAGVYLLQRRGVIGRIFLLLSAGIKYFTAPMLLLMKDKNSTWNKLAFLLFVALLVYLSFWQEIQAWYFLGLLIFLPFYKSFIQRLYLLFAGLLFSYYPYVRFGEWSASSQIVLKHEIIGAFFALNLLYLSFSYFKKPSR